MQTSLDRGLLDRTLSSLNREMPRRPDPPFASPRHPVHVFYGGAHLFRAGLAKKLGGIALRSLEEHAGTADQFGRAFGIEDSGLAAVVRDRVAAKLATEPIEDLRIDFEDGYGVRPAEEEDRHALEAARELAAGLEAG